MISIKNNREIKALYDKLLDAIKNDSHKFDLDKLRVFTTLVGREYPIEHNKGIIFYGRATNGWDDEEFNELEPVLEKEYWRPFFNLLYYFAWDIYGDSWRSKVAWSNICKIAPDGGNPSDALWYAQYDSIIEIIRKEVELLSPEIVVLVTGNTAGARWEEPFFEAFPNLKEIKSIKWAESRGYDCTATLFTDGKMKVLLTDRPEFRPIEAHSNALTTLLK